MSSSHKKHNISPAEKDLFLRKQIAFMQYTDSKKHCETIRQNLGVKWSVYSVAKGKMNEERYKLKTTCAVYRRIWRNFDLVRKSYEFRIKSLDAAAGYEQKEMKACFEKANEYRELGRGDAALVWSKDGHIHAARRNEIKAEIKRLRKELESVREDTKIRTPIVDDSAFLEAKAAFEAAQASYETTRTELQQARDERDAAKSKFETLRDEYEEIRTSY